MFAGSLQTGAQPQHFVGIEADQRNDRGQFRLALGQRTGLVHHQRVHLLHGFQRLGILDQHAQCRAATGADHDGHRRGQSQRARAGDDQHRHRVDDGMGEARLRSPDAPYCQCGECRQHHRRHEISGNHVGQALDRRARTLCLAHHVHDLSEQRIGADALGAHQQAAGTVHRGADQARARSLFHRDGFAGHHGFIQRTGAFQYHAIHRHLLAGTHAQHIVRLNLFQRDVFFAAVTKKFAQRFDYSLALWERVGVRGAHDARGLWRKPQ